MSARYVLVAMVWVASMGFVSAVAAAGVASTNDVASTNKELETVAASLAEALAESNFRGMLRSAIAQSKRREGIVKLADILKRGKSAKKPAPGLEKAGQAATRVNKGRVKATHPDLDGLDLYIPVEAHRAKWKGGKDFYIAYAPVGDEKEVREIVAFSVRDGKRVSFDPAKAPDAIVLVVAPEEHGSHEQLGVRGKGPVAPKDPDAKAQFEGKDAHDKPVKQDPGNSYVGLHFLKLYNSQEPWWLGDAEVTVYLGMKTGSTCRISQTNADYVNKTGIWYNTWDGFSPHVKRYFTRSYGTKIHILLMERDFSLLADFSNELFTIASGVTCAYQTMSTWDKIDSASTYTTNWNFGYDFRQYIGDAYLYWRKEH
ncbi:MAG: hypothetical protein ACI9GW_001535 [Halieaceae bacterium]|jgi:hypothetical protein